MGARAPRTRLTAGRHRVDATGLGARAACAQVAVNAGGASRHALWHSRCSGRGGTCDPPSPRAASRRGALGLMQLMPGTAALLGVRDAFDPGQNVDAGARHLRDLLDQFANDVSLALAAYNAGAQAVIKHGGMPPYPETRAFVARVLDRAGRMAIPAVAFEHASSTPPAPHVRRVRLTADRLRRGDSDSII